MSKKISFSSDTLKNNREVNEFLEDAGATYTNHNGGGSDDDNRL